jgi:hypothetical protein
MHDRRAVPSSLALYPTFWHWTASHHHVGCSAKTLRITACKGRQPSESALKLDEI